jgi:hypothetical protein
VFKNKDVVGAKLYYEDTFMGDLPVGGELRFNSYEVTSTCTIRQIPSHLPDPPTFERNTPYYLCSSSIAEPRSSF